MTHEKRSCLLNESKDYFNWLLEYSKTISKIISFFNEIKHEKRQIIFAIDFYDILLYSFPFLEIPLDKYDEKVKNRLVLNYLARSYVIDYYKKEKVILPPYIDELNNYFAFFNKFVNNHLSSTEDINKCLTEILNESNEEEKKKLIVEKFRDINQYLMLVYDDTDSRKILQSLFDETEGNNNRFLYLEDLSLDNNVIYDMLLSDNSDIENKFNKIRKNKRKIIQNIIDAKSIQLVNDLNNRQEKYLFFIISGAHSMTEFFDGYPEYTEKNSNFISLEFFKVLIDLTYDLDKESQTYDYDCIIKRAEAKAEEVILLYGQNLSEFKDIISTCPVIKEQKSLQISDELVCLPNCPNFDRCKKLLLEENIDNIKNYIEKKQNAKYIIKGVNPFTKRNVDIEKKFENKISKLKEFNSIINDEKNRKFYIERNNLFERMYIDENYIFLAKMTPYTQKISINTIEGFNDFPFYIFFKKESKLLHFIEKMQDKINDRDIEALTKLFQELVEHSVINKEKEESWLVWMLVFFTYSKYDRVIDFYKNNYSQSSKSKEYINEFLYIYCNAIYQEIISLIDEFESNKEKIFDLIESIAIATKETEDPRLLWIRIITVILFYEFDEFEKEVLVATFGENYLLTNNNLISRIDDLISRLGEDEKYSSFRLRCIMNKAYALALSENRDNIYFAKNIMREHLKFPDEPLKKEVNYLDTYAFIQMHVGLSASNFEEKKCALEEALKYFKEVLPRLNNKRHRRMIGDDMIMCGEELLKMGLLSGSGFKEMVTQVKES